MDVPHFDISLDIDNIKESSQWSNTSVHNGKVNRLLSRWEIFDVSLSRLIDMKFSLNIWIIQVQGDDYGYLTSSAMHHSHSVRVIIIKDIIIHIWRKNANFESKTNHGWWLPKTPETTLHAFHINWCRYNIAINLWIFVHQTMTGGCLNKNFSLNVEGANEDAIFLHVSNPMTVGDMLSNYLKVCRLLNKHNIGPTVYCTFTNGTCIELLKGNNLEELMHTDKGLHNPESARYHSWSVG